MRTLVLALLFAVSVCFAQTGLDWEVLAEHNRIRAANGRQELHFDSRAYSVWLIFSIPFGKNLLIFLLGGLGPQPASSGSWHHISSVPGRGRFGRSCLTVR